MSIFPAGKRDSLPVSQLLLQCENNSLMLGDFQGSLAPGGQRAENKKTSVVTFEGVTERG